MAAEGKYYRYMVIATIMLPGWLDIIISELVKLGYYVGPASDDGTLFAPNIYDHSPSSVLAINIDIPHRKSGKTILELSAEIKKIMEDNKIKSYSRVCVNRDTGALSWFGSNFELIRRRPVNPVKAEHLKLIDGGNSKDNKE